MIDPSFYPERSLAMKDQGLGTAEKSLLLKLLSAV
jgi:hypothetical protein